MISNICLCGSLKEKISSQFRLVEIERVSMRTNEVIRDLIPIAFWNPSPTSKMQRLPEGTLVMIVGRLERDEAIGLYVMCEKLEYLGNSNEATKLTIL